jgi:hypothetical protein
MMAGPDGPGLRDQVVEAVWNAQDASVRLSLDGEPLGSCCWRDPAWLLDAPFASGPLATHVSLGSAKANPKFRGELLACCVRAAARGLTGEEPPPPVDLD